MRKHGRTVENPEDTAGVPWSMMLTHLPLAAAVVGAGGEVLAFNSLFAALFPPIAQQPHGSIAALLEPDDRVAFRTMLAETFASADTPRSMQFALSASPTSSRRWMQASACRLQPAMTGSQTALLVQFVDLTDWKQREDELMERESRWNYALVSSSSGVWDQRLDRSSMYYSDVWRKIRGLSPDDPIAGSTEEWLLLVHPDDRERVLRSIERQNAGDPDYMTFSYRERHKDGHWIWIECRGACVEWTDDGKPARIIGIDTDITERKASEEALTRMSRRLKLALEASQIGVFEADFTTGLAEWDAGMRKIFRVEGEEDIPIGEVWEKMLHPEDAKGVFERLAQHVENLAPFSDEYRIIRSDGTISYIRSRTLPFIDSDGHRKMVGANWDVTADIALRDELDKAKTQAEARSRELEIAKARIEHIALHDHLTGLPNRRYLDKRLEELAGQPRSGAAGLAILHIDLDRFKQINDTLGHSAGDAMLRRAAHVLRKQVREGDFVARIGGDEFVFLARYTGDRQNLSALADRVIQDMRKPVPYAGQECRFSASIGIACDAKGAVDPHQLLLNADIALYHAKNSGRSRHAYFTLDRHARMTDNRRLADDILRGLEQDEFLPYYQFQFDARSLDIAGAEALARWRHPERGVLTPDVFLTAAEEIGVIADIDGLILEKALIDRKRWAQDGLSTPKISVNVSSPRLHDPALKEKLDALAFEPGTVSFELLESIFLDENDKQATNNLRHLRELGIEIEIDDFGTGHASIVSLLRLNPTTLKIDRELIQEVSESRSRRDLVGSIIGIGRSLGIRVVAEGVETADQVRVLRELDCDILQGYGLAVPMAFENTAAFIQRQEWRRIDLPA
ncbi:MULTISPECIES: sensor domain-containing protein [Alphaproteobacteria]|uniref:GGDEF domain-containing protein n=2 Tax=Alphaproteobacteria TaxID=28211 RepID=A0A512HCM4_9HYPH|nr:MULTISPECIES: EAL domain-containing protein [Alphaproteobacteria]GEO83198.1 hypothetical protein RNA01_01300 [Ciceribacter naphthalenivorans]GLR20407.1 hypothetical protein GCM10007920_01910 [Ciceribacter naphthalenivorans]GLT03263.1 hypothetical protein GCM10007926_01910 [Sphingomonas psychrolutea]